MHLGDMVYFWARTTPRRAAVIQPDGIVTYLALAHAIESGAEYFAANIPDSSKPVTVSVQTPSKMIAASLGLQRAGFSIIVAGKSDLGYIPAADSNTLIYERGGAPLEGRTNILFNESWLSTGPNVPSAKPLRQPRTKDSDVFFFTSGTTGRPKRIIRTQQAWEQRILFNGTSAFTDYERALIVTNPASAFGFTRAYEVLYAGKTACFAAVGQPLLWLANTYDVDLLIGSPHQALALADLQEKMTTRFPLAALKTVRLGGSVISREGIERIRNRLCRNVVLTYSSTEAGIVATAPYETIAHIPGAVGYIIPEAEVEIVDAEDRVLPVGSEGFVRVRSKQFLLNFGIDSPGAWFYPGDFGWLTDAGVLCIAGRKGDVINRGGAKLSVADLEAFLLSCQGVKDVGVCTLMGASGYEEIWVALVFAPSIDMAAFRQQIDSSTEFGSNIDRLFVVESIPRGQLGKIQRERLKEMLQSINEDQYSPAPVPR